MRITLSQAAEALLNSQVVAVSTETVFGLAALSSDSKAIESIFLLKNRPRTNPLIIHVADVQSIFPFLESIPPHFEALAAKFWPGGLTCVLPVKKGMMSDLVTAGLSTAGFRIPSSELTRELIRKVGPLVMPSANLSGKPSSTTLEHVENDFGKDFPILDSGDRCKGLESTIIYYYNDLWQILRLGAISPESFIPILHYLPPIYLKNQNSSILSPGQHFKHYAPNCDLYLGGLENLPMCSYIIGFKEREYPIDKKVLIIGSIFHPEEVAANLYSALRLLDEKKVLKAWVDMDFPKEGLWLTIAERLKRAGEKKV